MEGKALYNISCVTRESEAVHVHARARTLSLPFGPGSQTARARCSTKFLIDRVSCFVFNRSGNDPPTAFFFFLFFFFAIIRFGDRSESLTRRNPTVKPTTRRTTRSPLEINFCYGGVEC